MGAGESGDKLQVLGTKPSTDGPVSILLGLLAILAVAAEYQILMFIRSGQENAILQFLYIGLPLVAIVLAAQALTLGREGMHKQDGNSIFGVIGLFVSLLAFLLCAVLLGLSCAASIRLIKLF